MNVEAMRFVLLACVGGAILAAVAVECAEAIFRNIREGINNGD